MDGRMKEILKILALQPLNLPLCIALQNKRKDSEHGISSFLMFYLFFCFFLSFLEKQAASKELFNLHACPRCLKGGFHLGIFIIIIVINFQGYLKEVYNPGVVLRFLIEVFIQDFLLFFCFFSNFQEVCVVEAMALPITLTSLSIVIMNYALNICFMYNFSL